MAFADRPYHRQPDEPGLWGLRIPGGRSITVWLILANVAVFFVDGFIGRAQHGTGGLGVSALAEWCYFSFTDGVQYGQVWRFLTYQFFHADGWHLFWNMLGLFFFGPMVEDFLGSRRFLSYYVACGAAGAFLFMLLLGLGQLVPADRVPFLLDAAPGTPLLGASGAVFGVLMGAFRTAPHMTVMLMFVIPVPIRILIGLLLLLNIYGLMVSGSGGSAAHLGGMILGAVLIRRAHWLNWADRINLRHIAPQRLKRRAMQSAFERRMREQEELDREVDRILEKVSRGGLQSLTRREKRTLERATEKQRQE